MMRSATLMGSSEPEHCTMERGFGGVRHTCECHDCERPSSEELHKMVNKRERCAARQTILALLTRPEQMASNFYRTAEKMKQSLGIKVSGVAQWTPTSNARNLAMIKVGNWWACTCL